MNYIAYKFTISDVEPWREILIAVLSECPFESFIETETGIIGYLKVENDSPVCVEEQLQLLSTEVKVTYEKEEIEQENWNEKWESDFQPILVHNLCYIRAEFHASKPEIPYEIIIQPKMSFGTGHHETTYLMVEFILASDFKDKNVLDMGCGTSILGILAKMKGAKYVEGIDIDEWAVENSNENAQRNQVEITAKLGNASILGDKKFDTILANIQRNVLMEDIPTYVENLTKPGGELILSGLMETDFDDIKNKCEKYGLNFEEMKQRNEWIALKFTN